MTSRLRPSSALVRPGRFDRHIAVPLPDVRGRTQILKHHMQNIVTEPGARSVAVGVQVLMPMSRRGKSDGPGTRHSRVLWCGSAEHGQVSKLFSSVSA